MGCIKVVVFVGIREILVMVYVNKKIMFCDIVIGSIDFVFLLYW